MAQSIPDELRYGSGRLRLAREAVAAEKVEAMVALGVTNSRMKDFYDVHRLAGSFEFDGPRLVRTLRATCERRRTPIPEGEPLALAPGFLTAPERTGQSRAFLRRGRLDASMDAAEIMRALRAFVGPVLSTAAREAAFEQTWTAGGPWRRNEPQ